MDALMLHRLVAVDSAPAALPSAPERAVQRTYPGVPQQRDPSIELERLDRPQLHRAHSTKTFIGSSSSHHAELGSRKESDSTGATAVAGGGAPGTGRGFPLFEGGGGDLGRDLESSRPPTPSSVGHHHDSGLEVEAKQSITEPYMNRFRLLAVCLVNFGNGMSDSAPGALIPSMEKEYDIGYAIVSLIFVGNAIGFITAALFIDGTRERLGRAKTMALAQLFLAAGYVPMVCTAPFPVVVLSFFLVGFGMSFNLAMGNVFCGSLRNGTTALGMMHGAYGLGGTVGPLIATTLVTVAHTVWSRYYILTLGLALFNAVFAAWAFWDYDAERDAAAAASGTSMTAPMAAGEQTAAAAAAAAAATATARRQANVGSHIQGMFTAFSSRVVLLGALFIFAYQGAEVSISGWVISFLLDTRSPAGGGDSSSVGYVTAGFWAGITLGRFLLSRPAHRIGEKKFVCWAVAGATVFQLLVWLVPNIIGNAVAVAIVGLLLGPVYPCAAAVFMRNMSKHEQVSGIGVISAFGSSGGAAAPFTTGILAQAVGTFVLHPIAIGLFAVMMGCWYGLPGRPKRAD
ncbi:major facilitator superfamily domain-containing protein [Bombardia bombarda]|uniref:Major facilitator superfamily domain-containing protein n=1 Tax=Bombardia bombarda TaxID=252184 RepID=A0AA40CFY3_9PEZI|nr:major facilitator superfamily domain-containing protein [Bombardia bombarda]